MRDLDALVAALTPFWAAEAEICRTHLDRPERSLAVDAEWLARQAAKELRDGVMPRSGRLQTAIEAGAPADLLARETEELHEEAVHYAAFVTAHDVVAASAGLPPLRERDLETVASWPANAELAALRASHQRLHDRAGELATTLTEGGCAALFAVGVGLRGAGPVDDAIAGACAAVLDDEVEHLRTGIDDLAGALDDIDAGLVTTLAIEQSRQRLRMRQAQFGDPVPAGRFAELLGGAATPGDIADVEQRLGRRMSRDLDPSER